MTARPLTDDERAIITGGNLGHLATLRADGSPHVTPVWVDVEGDLITFNTAEGRDKLRHVRRDPRVALSVAGRESDFRTVWISGRVVEVTTEGAWDHAHALARRYLGQERYTFGAPGEVRVIVRIRPEAVHSILM
ncbi:MAG: PPOX class F420-dependent oxidoreductase [Thermoleophilia bacterium]|jgi:PPOX class probable F420-dependent enzyme|nr:PPOX class F420-dependent oxidoreductase [Thermoleophilia bacterium]